MPQRQGEGGWDLYNISFKGDSCANYGIIPVRRPSVPAPEIRVEETQIPGMDGTLVETDGAYNNIVIPVEFNFLVPSDKWMAAYRRAKRWLTGSGNLILGDDQEYFYKVLYCNITSAERTSRRLGNLEAEFTCYPYAFLVSGQIKYAPAEVEYNPYMVSHPVYIITGSGGCDLTVNGNKMDVTVNQEITIDTDRMVAYNDEMVNQSNLLSGNYEDLYLLEGQNTISITDGFNLSVIPNWRVL